MTFNSESAKPRLRSLCQITFIAAAISGLLIAQSEAVAGDRDALCTFNNGTDIKVTVSRDVITPGASFTLFWSDGPK